MKNILMFLLILSLYGCVTTPKVKDTNVLKQDEGVLVVGLDTDWEGHNNPLLASLELLYNGVDDSALIYKKLGFKGKNHILVTTLPSKKYYFYRIRFGNRYADLKEGATFEIEPGKITYIGEIKMDLDLKLFSAKGDIHVSEKWEDTLNYLRENYPMILKDREVVKSLINLEMTN